MGTLWEWFSVFSFVAFFCTLFVVFLEPFGANWQESLHAKLLMAVYLFSSALVMGMSNAFGWRRSFHGGLLWISSASALAMLASGITVRRLRRRNDQKSPD